MTLLDAVRTAGRRLAAAGLTADAAATDAEVLARHALGWDRATWLCRRREPPPARFAADYRPLVARRTRREPVSAITGRREFWGLAFEVGPAVLTPRPETELAVELALDLCRGRRRAPLRILDVGTGSGCLAVALARELPAARITGVDLSPAALAVARRNARAHGVAGRIGWLAGSILDAIRPAAGVDLLVANLPYVPSAAVPTLAPEVRDHEPRLALDGGPDGLDPLRALLGAAAARLAADGHVVAELGAGQAAALPALVASAPGLALVTVARDLAGIPRAAAIRRS